jgi:small-conductance mechanosensitive channel
MDGVEWIEWFKSNSHDLLLALGIAALALVFERLITRTLHRLQAAGSMAPLQARLMRRGVQWVALFLVALAIFSIFSEGIALWKYLSAVLAVVGVGFVAQWSFLSNVLAGFIILVWRPFRLGDQVSLFPDGPAGKVEDINTMFTFLRADDGSRLAVPNNHFLQHVVKCGPANPPPA